MRITTTVGGKGRFRRHFELQQKKEEEEEINLKIKCKQLPAITAESELVGATVVNTEGKKIEHLKKSLPNTLKIKCTIVNTKINTIQQINATKGIKVQQKYTKLEKKDKQMLKEVL